ncbi:MAG TPA: 1-(5-phosphoribosyl)-5-[(5-phosphoribosylamino)methylideneamino] imidazole-4-carboxamide isomerase [Candidatus Limnocylindrales bacterium]
MATTFDVLPAIDLRGGRVVRLEEGDFERETAFADDPAAVAVGFADDGARWLHVVDLDAARTGRQAHGDAIEAITASVGARVSVEVAGGLRTDDAVAAALARGAARAVVGTAAIRDAAFAGRLVGAHGPGRIAVAIDVREGRAVGRGWSATDPGVDAADAIRRLADAGVETFEVTAIERDGLLSGPNLALYEQLVALGRGAIVASGGIATVEDITAVRTVGCSGVIIGRALYEGRLTLRDAMDATR